VAGYLKEFLFSEPEMKKPARNCSGGETNRLLLAKLFARPSNLLVLDEPTNDLDAETLELLEDLLLDYEGTIILVSHDREFLDNVATECFVLRGDGTVAEYSGGYSEWREREQKRRQKQDGSRGRSGRDGGAKRKGGRRREGRGGTDGRSRKLGFKERKELAELPDRIAALEEEQAEIHEKLADPSLYREGDGASPRELTERLQEVEQEITAAYERWEELDALST
jgi:ATP-binding cassette subfamily F protein uup